MKAFVILASLLSLAVANPLFERDACACDISKCPAGNCDCITGLMDACYVAQTKAGTDCGKPVYPACGGSIGDTCASDEICYYTDKACDPHTQPCTGICANDYCGGHWDRECPDSRWSCVYDETCEKNGGVDCDGQCILN
ncbi:uncharacterized protein BDR25DRAFT_375234 [Lindgomyces ingoldianus]|uniref:Uncharacterized protein n=1 Tax=Lindgomyces ingoldianus TaxID=673940 RepID=A0ACB6RBB7_9PLEO|nr:uncharacterized protein BDR25DRAFT_375234 [Lindgomyces ingoldianus]KAF2476340.1 hypothetical protein BDR25DRAFT_375234 [Lindgomyces ingoldianus]